MRARDWFEYHELKAAGVAVLEPLPGQRSTPAPTTTTEDTTVDLGDIYDTVDTALGGWLPGGVPLGSVVPTGGLPSFVGPTTAPVATVPAVTTATPSAAPGAVPHGYAYKMTPSGPRWVKIRKKRCKRLLTATQARDLQLLMSITGKSSELTKIIVARGGLC